MADKDPEGLTAAVPHPIRRLVVYYAVTLPTLAAILHFVPAIGRAMAVERQRIAGGADFVSIAEDARGITAGTIFDVDLILAITASLVGAVLFALPVAWVYQATRRKRGYEKGVAQTLLILPIAIAAVVFLVKNSLALAFGLAGIVAAVRFRHTLDDTMDAVFLFVAIALGLAAGAQLLTVTAIASIFFNFAVLVVWWTDFGDRTKTDRRPAED